MTRHGRWARVFVDDERCLVYGPSVGRLYLVTAQQALEHPFQRLLGLRALTRCDSLADPALRIVHTRAELQGLPQAAAPVALR